MKGFAFAAIAAGTIMAGSIATASAFDNRAENLTHRIEAGVRDGSLTWQESRNLRAELNAVRHGEYLADRGGLTATERRYLTRRYDSLSTRVFTMRHNRQHGWHRSWHGRAH
jgi:hypothetical protein